MAAPQILPPQNSPVFQKGSGDSWSMAKAWVLFFQELYKLSLSLVTKITTGAATHFVSVGTDGSFADSGYSAASFLKIADMPTSGSTRSIVSDVTGGTPNIQKKTYSQTIANGLVTSVGAVSSSTDVKPKAYQDIAISLRADPAGLSIPSLISWNGGTISVYAFSGTISTDQLFGQCEYNHQFREGSDISPHVHWAPTTNGAGNVKWNLTYVWDNPFSGPSSEKTISITTAASGTAFKLNKAIFPDITGSGKQIGSQIQFRLWRNPADAADTYGAAAAIQTFGFHCEVDSFGSTTTTVK